jgi:hypothetical protein
MLGCGVLSVSTGPWTRGNGTSGWVLGIDHPLVEGTRPRHVALGLA